jgi:hypothetical protein
LNCCFSEAEKVYTMRQYLAQISSEKPTLALDFQFMPNESHLHRYRLFNDMKVVVKVRFYGF